MPSVHRRALAPRDALRAFSRAIGEIVGSVPTAAVIVIACALALETAILLGMVSSVGSTTESLVYNGLLLAGPALCLARAVRHRQERAIWIAFAVGTALWAFGNIYWQLFLDADDSPPFPSVSDGFWLAFYVPVLAGLWMLARARMRGVNRRVWLDGLIVGLGLGALSASVVFREVAHSTDGSMTTIAVNLAYPAADLLVLIVISVLFRAAHGRADRTLRVLMAAVGLFLVTDSIYLVEIANGTYASGSLIDLGWPMAIVLVGAAAWQPAAQPRTATQDSSITLPITLVCVCAALLTYDHFVRLEAVAVVLSAAAVFAALLRLVLTYRSANDLLERTQEAVLTDNLTSLGNRARLLRDLERALRRTDSVTVLAFYDLDGFKNYNDSFGHPAGDALLHRLAGRLAAAMPAGGTAYRMGGDEFCALVPADDAQEVEALLAPAGRALKEEGDGFLIGASCGHVLVPTEATTPSHALTIADHRLYEHKNSGRVSARRQTRQVLKRVLDERDRVLSTHMDDVARLAELTAVGLGLDEHEIERVVLAAELHDIGKSAIPDAILFKPGPLSGEELSFMRRHTVIGERILASAPALAPVAHVVRSSHERYDGTGYPDGLSGEEIPLGSRIVFVCDAFDAMTSERPYSPPLSAAAALEELRACAGTQFDPAVVSAFARAHEAHEREPAATGQFSGARPVAPRP
jgi:diguanylate cyclase (GGDEF)-like protein